MKPKVKIKDIISKDIFWSRVIWEFNEKIGKWSVGFEEIEPAVD